MSLAAGEVVAGYTVVRSLGMDGMGEVYLATHPRPPHQVALRVLPAVASDDGPLRARVERQADLAADLWHPHLVAVRDRGVHLGRLWIATDVVDGTDAARLMRERYPDGMPAEEVLEIVSAIAEALDYAHGRHLTHGNVTAASILLTSAPERRILLTGMGIPSHDVGPDDQYALAATALHLLTGSARFTPPLGGLRPHLVAFEPALERALAMDLSRRFATCTGFAAALGAGSTDLASTMAAPLVPFHAPETGPKHPAFVPAWSEEPAPNPYLDPYPDDPYPDPDLDPSHAPTMTAIPVPPGPPPHVEPPSGPSNRTWAVAGVAAAIVVVLALVIALTRGGNDADQPIARPQAPTSQQPAPPPPVATQNGRPAPPPVAGPDGVGETCLDGFQITGREGWASHAVRGNPAATCTFTGNVLKAYWDAADPDDAPRTVTVAGAIPCSGGAQCAGDRFVVTCGVEGSDPWVTCRGGRNAIVYLY